MRALRHQRVLVTGASGFIGRAVVRRAADHGVPVLAAVRGTSDGRTGDVVTLALDEVSGLVDAIEEFAPTIVVHAAGAASVANSVLDPAADRLGNVQTWVNVLDALRRTGVAATAVNVSSAAVYGEPEQLPIKEDSVCRPISPYGHHKLQAELIGEEYSVCFGVPVVSARVFSVMGPEQRRLLGWEIAAQALGDAPEVVLRGTGHESRDFIHVEDLSEALLVLGACTTERFVPSTRVNLATGVETSIATLAETIVQMVSPAKPLRFLGQRSTNDPQRWQADTARLSRLAPDWSARPLDATLADCLAAWEGSVHH